VGHRTDKVSGVFEPNVVCSVRLAMLLGGLAIVMEVGDLGGLVLIPTQTVRVVALGRAQRGRRDREGKRACSQPRPTLQ